MLTFNILSFLIINLSNFQSLFSISQITAYFNYDFSVILLKKILHTRAIHCSNFIVIFSRFTFLIVRCTLYHENYDINSLLNWSCRAVRVNFSLKAIQRTYNTRKVKNTSVFAPISYLANPRCHHYWNPWNCGDISDRRQHSSTNPCYFGRRQGRPRAEVQPRRSSSWFEWYGARSCGSLYSFREIGR